MIIEYLGKKWDTSIGTQRSIILGIFKARIKILEQKRDKAIKEFGSNTITREELDKLYSPEAHKAEKQLRDIIAKI